MPAPNRVESVETEQVYWRTFFGRTLPKWLRVSVLVGGPLYIAWILFASALQFGDVWAVRYFLTWNNLRMPLLVWLFAFGLVAAVGELLKPIDKIGWEEVKQMREEHAKKRAEEAANKPKEAVAKPQAEDDTEVELRKHLLGGERIDGRIRITYKPEGHTVVKDGLAVVTDRRLLTVYKGVMGGSAVEQYPYDKISSVDYRTGVLVGRLVVRTSDKEMSVVLDKDGGRDFSRLLNESMARYKGDMASARVHDAPNVGTADLVTQLERLATLHNQGLLGDDEFKSAKERLLGTKQ